MPETVTKRERYFIGANTSAGFVNYTDEILCGLKKVYIIKGGPGTGKSTFMKRIVDYAGKQGMSAEEFFCSSDSGSLDGVVLRDSGIGIIDGTPPHSADPKYPGAREEIIDFGAFWNTNMLEARFPEIKELSDRKSGLFATAYKYLSVCRSIRNEREALLSACRKNDKARAAVCRLFRRAGQGKGFRLIPRQISAVGMNGITEFDTIEKKAAEIWLVSDRRGTSGTLFGMMVREAEKLGLETHISRNYLLEPDALYFPEPGIAVLSSCDAGIASRIINTDRFIDPVKLAEKRAAMRFLVKLENELFSRALGVFSEIKSCHFAVEDIYRQAMDFDRLDEAFERVIARI